MTMQASNLVAVSQWQKNEYWAISIEILGSDSA